MATKRQVMEGAYVTCGEQAMAGKMLKRLWRHKRWREVEYKRWQLKCMCGNTSDGGLNDGSLVMKR
ncbi:MAG TPA: hypothetical protein VFQ73_06255 [Flavisolibacter sp.]|nr:hypothetical protein [Flavisolibacter sp.]